MIVLKNTPVNQIFYIMRNAKNESDCWDLTHSTVEFNSNGTYTIAAPKGYDGLSYVTVKVDVEGACTGIETSESEINSAKEGGEHIIGISSSSAWTATASEDWITVTPNSGEGGVAVITITVSENEGEERTGTVTIVNDNGDVNVIDITQEEGEIDYSTRYLTLEALEDGLLKFKAQNAEVEGKEIQYRVNNGNWIPAVSSWTTPNVAILVAGDVVEFKGYNSSYGAYVGNNLMSNHIIYSGECVLSGNIMSLIDGDNYTELQALTADCTFVGLFDSCKCTNAENVVLPATQLTESCYTNLFRDCTLLTAAPTLPATTLAEGCYVGMFANCESLTEAPALPATVLPNSCYAQMFSGCTSLTTAPELPATTITSYATMFKDCINLNYIKCLATRIQDSFSTNNWTSNVSPTGTFVCPDPSIWTTGASGIPSGWTVETI